MMIRNHTALGAILLLAAFNISMYFWGWHFHANDLSAYQLRDLSPNYIASNTITHEIQTSRRMPLGVEGYDCVYNPSRHYEITGVWRTECTVITPPSFSRFPENAWPSAAYMLSLDTDESLKAYKSKKIAFARHKFDLQRFIAVNGLAEYGHLYRRVPSKLVENTTYVVYSNPRMKKDINEGHLGYLTAGEEGYRGSMAKLLKQLLSQDNISSVLVVDDDVMLSCTFARELKDLLKEPRCGGHVSLDADHGGVLMLGASIWLNGTYPQRGPWLSGWNIVDEDLRRSEEQQARVVPGGPTCFNVPSKVMGSFAVIYHRNVFEHIINWLETSSRPFDHVFEALADAGFIVRAAYPSIAVQDLRHESSVDPRRKSQEDFTGRAKLHRWQLDRICHARSNRVLMPATDSSKERKKH